MKFLGYTMNGARRSALELCGGSGLSIEQCRSFQVRRATLDALVHEGFVFTTRRRWHITSAGQAYLNAYEIAQNVTVAHHDTRLWRAKHRGERVIAVGSTRSKAIEACVHAVTRIRRDRAQHERAMQYSIHN